MCPALVASTGAVVSGKPHDLGIMAKSKKSRNIAGLYQDVKGVKMLG